MWIDQDDFGRTPPAHLVPKRSGKLETRGATADDHESRPLAAGAGRRPV